MHRKLDIGTWKRKDHYLFFKDFDEPFFGITLNIDCTKAHACCKKYNISFFLYYLHASLVAANQVEEFRYRIVGDDVVVYDKVNASPTINRPDGTFGFSYMEYHHDYRVFEKEAMKEIERVRNSTGLKPAGENANVIHYSAIPWIRFTALSHARNLGFRDSCPKISFGQMDVQNEKKEMPVSIHGHHALMDGVHVGEFIKIFQEVLNRE